MTSTFRRYDRWVQICEQDETLMVRSTFVTGSERFVVEHFTPWGQSTLGTFRTWASAVRKVNAIRRENGQ